MICTWKNCNKQAIKPQLDKNGKQWAKLCQQHHDELESALDLVNNKPFNPKILLRAWILASGGAKEMVKNF